jgi:hypothetical protein
MPLASINYLPVAVSAVSSGLIVREKLAFEILL